MPSHWQGPESPRARLDANSEEVRLAYNRFVAAVFGYSSDFRRLFHDALEAEVRMPYVCRNVEQYKNKVFGFGQCVDFVKVVATTPPASMRKQGKPVKRANLEKGTVIATFEGGSYPNKPTGNHAAIYLRQDSHAIYVLDQWKGKSGNSAGARKTNPIQGRKPSTSRNFGQSANTLKRSRGQGKLERVVG